jgi:regulation of enolase protein 1 (concanavalin A-like superfamily)
MKTTTTSLNISKEFNTEFERGQYYYFDDANAQAVVICLEGDSSNLTFEAVVVAEKNLHRQIGYIGSFSKSKFAPFYGEFTTKVERDCDEVE